MFSFQNDSTFKWLTFLIIHWIFHEKSFLPGSENRSVANYGLLRLITFNYVNGTSLSHHITSITHSLLSMPVWMMFEWAASTLMHYILFEIWVVKSIQIPKGQYRDHLVGQLTRGQPTVGNLTSLIISIMLIAPGEHLLLSPEEGKNLLLKSLIKHY